MKGNYSISEFMVENVTEHLCKSGKNVGQPYSHAFPDPRLYVCPTNVIAGLEKSVTLLVSRGICLHLNILVLHSTHLCLHRLLF